MEESGEQEFTEADWAAIAAVEHDHARQRATARTDQPCAASRAPLQPVYPPPQSAGAGPSGLFPVFNQAPGQPAAPDAARAPARAPAPGPTSLGAGPSGVQVHAPAWQPHSAFKMPAPIARPPAPGAVPGAAGVTGVAGVAGVAAYGVDPAAAPTPTPTPALVRPPPQPYDESTIGTWIYPSSSQLQERAYQFEIASIAVRHNTLVSLPTGLGKTLIASVVMYNLSRWFPTGRCVFLAPTKPLVHQQVSAVRHATGMRLSSFAELTGSMKQPQRAALWSSASMLFLTPQTLYNDLLNGTCPAQQVVCLVVDEAHKATGNHSYTQVVKKLTQLSGGFRLLALSATPGQTLERIQEVVTNLRISRLEARDETSIDVVGCLHERKQETVVLPLEDGVAAARDAVGRVYSKTLRRLAGLVHETDISRLPRYLLVTAQRKYMSAGCDPSTAQHVFYRNVAAFSVAIMMGGAYELASVYGCGACLTFLLQYLECPDKPDFDDEMADEDGEARPRRRAKAKAKPPGKMVKNERRSLFSSPEFESMLGLVQHCSDAASHPKLEHTVRLLREHFAAHGEGSRVMVFTTYRSAVAELMRWLGGVDGVRPMQFIGQSAGRGEGEKGMPQKEQRAVVKQFRSGTHNVLVATSIGEEGLDIGEVDLIICYDAIGSATRTTQRYGRTGRKHAGRVVTLLTAGYEEAVW